MRYQTVLGQTMQQVQYIQIPKQVHQNSVTLQLLLTLMATQPMKSEKLSFPAVNTNVYTMMKAHQNTTSMYLYTAHYPDN